jgi:hypothetical protein
VKVMLVLLVPVYVLQLCRSTLQSICSWEGLKNSKNNVCNCLVIQESVIPELSLQSSFNFMGVVFIMLMNLFCAIYFISAVSNIKDNLTEGKRQFYICGKSVECSPPPPFFLPQVEHRCPSFQGICFHSNLYLFVLFEDEQQILSHISVLARIIHFVQKS